MPFYHRPGGALETQESSGITATVPVDPISTLACTENFNSLKPVPFFCSCPPNPSLCDGENDLTYKSDHFPLKCKALNNFHHINNKSQSSQPGLQGSKTRVSKLQSSGHCLSLSIKFYWHTATPIHLHIACGCFHDTTAELSRHDRDCTATELKYLTGLVQRQLVDSCAERPGLCLLPRPHLLSLPVTGFLQPYWTAYCSPNCPAPSHLRTTAHSILLPRSLFPHFLTLLILGKNVWFLLYLAPLQ